MKKIALLFIAIFATFTFTQAQTLDELKAQKAERVGVKKGIDTEIADLEKLIREFPGWTNGFSGIIGANAAGSNNWFQNEVETSASRGVGIGFNAFANGNMEKYFVKNDLNIAIVTQKVTSEDILIEAEVDANGDAVLDADGNPIETGITVPTDLSSITSNFTLKNLSGYKFTEQFAASAEAAYETGIVARNSGEEDPSKEGNLTSIFNNPGQLTFSAGASWIPNSQTFIFIHPIGYQWTFPGKSFASVAGAKVGATYQGDLIKGINWKTDFSAFLAYGKGDVTSSLLEVPQTREFSAGDLTNWTWLNTITVANVFKGIGLGATLGLRDNKQLPYKFGDKFGDTFEGKLQSYYTIGLSYAIGG